MVTGLGTVNQNPQQIGFSQQNEQQKRSSDNRRSNKPIMEKRRRARINNSLNELKTLILDAMKKDPARHSKLEKADILEMAVKYLQNLQRQQVAMTTAADPNVLNKFRAGFNECATEVGKFPGLDPAFKRRLLQHLATCLSGSTAKQETSPTTQVQVHILPSPPSSPEQSPPNNSSNNQLSAAQNGIYFTNGTGSGYQLVPTRLPNGDIALVLPTTNASSQYRQPETQSPLPMLIPIPSRTASTASASSSSSSNSGYERLSVNSRNSPSVSPYCAPLSPPSSHHGYDMDVHRIHSPPLQAPLSLVMKKKKSYEIAAEEEKPWRPW